MVFVFLLSHLHIVNGLVVATGGHCPPERPVEQLPGAVALAEVPEKLKKNSAAALTFCGLLHLFLLSSSFISIFSSFTISIPLRLLSRLAVEEHALLWHGQEDGGEQGDGGEHQRELGDAVEGQELQADQDLTQHCAHRVA